MAVRLADINVDEDNIQKSDATPTGYNLLSGVGTENKIKGTDGADKATIDTLYHDKDQVINLGAGSDIFVFQVNDEKSDINGKRSTASWIWAKVITTRYGLLISSATMNSLYVRTVASRSPTLVSRKTWVTKARLSHSTMRTRLCSVISTIIAV